MKVLFIQKEGGIFGAENFQLKIIPSLMKNGIEIEFLRLYTDYQGGKGGDFIEKLKSFGVKTYEINIGKVPKVSNLIRIKKLINSGEYNLVHTHLIHADLHLSLIKLLLGSISCRWISTKHGYDNDFTAKYGFDASKQGITPYYLLCKLSEQVCDKSYTISHGLRNFFIETGITKPDKMDMIHYGFDLDETSDELFDNEYRKFKKQIIIAGRLVSFKGHKYLIRSLTQLVENNSEVGLVIVGSGNLETELKVMASELNLDQHIYFAGYSNEVTKWMYNSDVVAVPSISEGFGVVFLEAFNCKKPVVAWNVPAGNELMRHGETGYLVPAYDINKLSIQFKEIFSSLNKSLKVGENAYKLLKEYYSLDRMTNETIRFYHSIVKE